MLEVGNEITYKFGDNVETPGYISDQNENGTFLLRFYDRYDIIQITSEDTKVTVYDSDNQPEGFAAITLTDETGAKPFVSIRIKQSTFDIFEAAAKRDNIPLEDFMRKVFVERLDKMLEEFQEKE